MGVEAGANPDLEGYGSPDRTNICFKQIKIF
jgi:hypothetical protein